MITRTQSEAMADFLAALSENFRLARDMVLHREDLKAVEVLADKMAQQLTVIRCNAEFLKGDG